MQGSERVTERLPRAILFDLDDTIISASAATPNAMERVCAQFAPRTPGVSAEGLYSAFQDAAMEYWSEPGRQRRGRLNPAAATLVIAESALDSIGVYDQPGLAEEIAESYLTTREKSLTLYPGAIETLEKLRGEGVRLALITNGSAEGQRGKVVRFGLERYFGCIVIEGEFGVGKPDERVYRHALAALDTEPGDAWMVGDNLEWEVATPQRLGLRGVWVDWAGVGLPEGTSVRPDRIVRAISELV